MTATLPISVVINTKNEAHHIAECIQSVKPFAKEILIVDMHSTDATREIVKKLGVRVLLTKDVGYVEPGRNFALQSADHPWVLLLDADERVPTSLAQKLKAVAKADEADAVWIPRKNIRLGKWMQHGGFWADEQMRFFKRKVVTWSDQIHSQPHISGRELHLPDREEFALIHFNIESTQQIFDKIDSFTKHEEYFSNLGVVTAEQLHHILRHEFVHRFFTQEGYKDGIHGFLFAKTMEYYRFVEFVRYWEQKGYPEFFSGIELKNLLDETARLSSLETQWNEFADSKFYLLYRVYLRLKSLFQRT